MTPASNQSKRRPTKAEYEARARRQLFRLLFREAGVKCSLAETDRRAAIIAGNFGREWAPMLAKSKRPLQSLAMLTDRLIVCGHLHAVTGPMLLDLLNAADAVIDAAKSNEPAKLIERLGLLLLSATDGVAGAREAETEQRVPLTWGELEGEDLAAEYAANNGRQTLDEGASGTGN